LPRGRIDQKRRDAEAMVASIRVRLSEGLQPMRVTYELAETVAWQAARRRVDSTIG